MNNRFYILLLVFSLSAIVYSQELSSEKDLTWLSKLEESETIFITQRTGNSRDGYIYLRKEVPVVAPKKETTTSNISNQKTKSVSSSSAIKANFENIPERYFYLSKSHNVTSSYHSSIDSNIKRYLRASYLSRVIPLFEFYEPLFDAVFTKHNIPLELKYIAIIESMMNPRIHSPVGASGLWQFMPETGKFRGLKLNSSINMFYDPVSSTDAAARHLKYLYDLLGDWNLVIVAYNCGEGRVLRDIKRSGTKDIWELRKHLPKETQGYIANYHAIRYVMSYYKDYNIKAQPLKLAYKDIKFLTADKDLDLKTLALNSNKDFNLLKFLNPQLLGTTIPRGSIYYFY